MPYSYYAKQLLVGNVNDLIPNGVMLNGIMTNGVAVFAIEKITKSFTLTFLTHTGALAHVCLHFGLVVFSRVE